ncbi:MAG: hypothetical protein KDE32_14720 [Novosphingobium sp.]|nr:hypothetical protein [Novosphingobium sp.]
MTLVTQGAALRTPECEGADETGAGGHSPAPNGQQALQDRIADKIAKARRGVSEHLGMLLSTHMGSGGLRNGTMLRDCIEAMAVQAGRLVDDIFDDLDPLPRTPVMLQEIREGFVHFIEFLDGELDRSAQRVELELEHAGGRHGITAAARNLWSENRNQLIDMLEHRIEQAQMDSGPRRSEAETPDCEDESASPLPANDLPEPGFELIAKAISPAPTSSMRKLALEGQPVQRIKFEADPQPVSDSKAEPEVGGNCLEAWADMIVEICKGSPRPRKQAEWRDAFQKACDRNQIAPDPADLDEWAQLVWRKLVTSRFVLSQVGKEIRREAENPQEGSDEGCSFLVAPRVSTGSSGGFGRSQDPDGSAVRVLGLQDDARPAPAAIAEAPGKPSAPSMEAVRDLSTAIAIAVPVIAID